MAKQTTPRSPAQPRGPGKRDLITKAAFVLVETPTGVKPGTTVFARGQPRLVTGTAGPLPIGEWNLLVVNGTERWVAEIDILDPGPADRPIRVTLQRAAPLAGSVAVVRGTGGPRIGPDGPRTIVYVHGIGNKPTAEVLRCQWDRALLDGPLGDRSRLAYWVDRARYPTAEAGSCNGADMSLPGAAGMAARAAGLTAPSDPPAALAAALTDDAAQQRVLERIAARMSNAASEEPVATPGRASTRVLPGGRLTRRWLARWLTDMMLPDVYDYLFDRPARERMLDSLADRLRGGGEPFVIVAHSLGSVIAYELLRRFKPGDCDVALFVTLGSPLGMQEIRDHLEEDGKLLTPACVRRWVDVYDRLDPVALGDIAGNYGPNTTHRAEVRSIRVDNLDQSMNPHSGTGYLRTSELRTAVREVTGQAFASPMARSAIAADVAAVAEAGRGSTLHDVLIQLDDQDGQGAPAPLAEVAERLVEELRSLAASRPASVESFDKEQPEVLRRFVAAKLTRSEIESLRTRAADLKVRLVWANAKKRALIATSAAVVQALPAQLGYGARGQGISWAVLDTGIDEDHPHFKLHKNIRAQWDCTERGPPKPLTGGAKADPNGHGTHVAAIIAGELEGKLGGRKQTMAGMAPETGIFGFRVLGADGAGSDSAIIKALDKVASLNEDANRLVVHGVNLSLGAGYDPSIYGCGHTPLCQELRRLWRQGVIVVLAAGNEGYATLQSADGEMALNLDLSIGDPANLDEAIAVGSVHKENPHTYGISYFSSRGPTADGRQKPDCVAPGERIISAHSGGRPPTGSPDDLANCYVEMSGTSMAAPHVSGVLAGFLSARREFIGYPDRARRILVDNCTDLKRDPNMQGAGLVNLVKMLLST
jgi:subtilisin family serine protease